MQDRATSWLSTIVVAALVTGCIGGTRDSFMYVSLANQDATVYVVLAQERGFEDVPVGYALGPEESGFMVRSGGWQGRVSLVDRATCQVLDDFEVGSAGTAATIHDGAFLDISDGPPRPGDLLELLETQHCG